MSIKSAPYYWVECDGCGARSTNGGDFSAWADAATAEEDAHGAGWTEGNGKHYCDGCTESKAQKTSEKCEYPNKPWYASDDHEFDAEPFLEYTDDAGNVDSEFMCNHCRHIKVVRTVSE